LASCTTLTLPSTGGFATMYIYTYSLLYVYIAHTYICIHSWCPAPPTLTLLSISGFATIHYDTTYIFMYIYIYVHTWRLAHFDVAVHMWLMYIYRYTHMHIYMCIYTCVMRILHVAQWMSHVAHVCHFHACCMRAHSKSRLTHVTHLNKSCHIYHLRMCHDAFRRVAGLIKCIMCVTWLVDIFDMTHSSLCYVCVTWQVDVLDTTHLRCMI